MYRCPSCSRAMLDEECVKCRAKGIPEGVQKGWGDWPIDGPGWVVACLGLTLVFPPLILLTWPLLSLIFARVLYRIRASRIEDLFLRILAGAGLAVAAGLGAAFLLFVTCSGGVLLWSGFR